MQFIVLLLFTDPNSYDGCRTDEKFSLFSTSLLGSAAANYSNFMQYADWFDSHELNLGKLKI